MGMKENERKKQKCLIPGLKFPGGACPKRGKSRSPELIPKENIKVHYFSIFLM